MIGLYLHPPIPENQMVNCSDDKELAEEEGIISVPTGNLRKTTNERTLVIKQAMRRRGLPLPADIPKTTEELPAESDVDLRSAPLMVPHHRSSSSSGLPVSGRFPPIAVVSRGYKNLFGSPHPDTLDKYKQINADLYRTDHDGAIRGTADGRNILVD